MVSLCGVSSETTRQANLGAAHRKAAAVRMEKSHQSHAHMHEHFEDQPIAGTAATVGKNGKASHN
jgi:hypothetical protein